MYAFIHSIVLMKHNMTAQNQKEYLTAEQLCLEINGKQSGESTSMTVVCAAVHQGLPLLRRALLIMGYAMNVLAATDHRDQAMDAFYELRSLNTGWKIKFHSMTSEHVNHDETMRAIISMKNELSKLRYFKPSNYTDLRIIHYELNSRVSKSELSTPSVEVVRRKNVSDLGKRYFESMVSNAMDAVDAEYSSNSVD